MTDEFKFRESGTSILLSFGELDKHMQERYEMERDKIESRLIAMATKGIIEIGDIDRMMQQQFAKERDHIENRLIEIFDRRTTLKQQDDKLTSIGNMKAGDVIVKFR